MTQKLELEFLPDYHYALRGETNRFAYLITICVVVFAVGFLVWADRAILDEVTRGEARVVPSSKIQVVQNLEGGILSELLISDGQIIQKGDVLLRIANTKAETDYRDSHVQYLRLEAMIARLEAEGFNTPLQFPKDVMAEAPEIAENERALYKAQINQIDSQVAVIRDQLTQRRQEIVELAGKQQTMARSLDLARQELAISAPLVATGAAAKVDVVRLQRQVAELEGKLSEIRLSLPRSEAARDESQRRIDEKIASFRSDAQTDLNKRRAELNAISEKGVAEQDRVTRTEVRSPVRGIVKELKVNTVGGVIRPGQDLVDIVPLEDTLLVEAKIRPADIAFVRPGQPATVKITAYDFSIYGGLKANLEQISADTIKEENPNQATKGEFFRVTLRTDKNSLGTEDKPLPIIPGMTATAEILTGHKTVLDYLLKPILKVRDRALRER